MNSITIGQYIAGGSILHRMDARIKIILTICYIALLFIISTPVSYALFTAGTIALVLMSGISPRYFMRAMKPMLYIIAFTCVINLFFTGGEPIFELPVFGLTLRITYEGAEAALTVLLRLALLITGTSLLTLSTAPLSLADGIESLLKPLRVIKVPASEIALMMTIAIRFIPTLSEELDKIKRAQEARGADFSSRNIIRRAKAMVPIMVPLFVSAFKRADDLATAMDARCYRGGAERTKLHCARITALDIKACAVFAAAAAVMVIV
ncbi:MAG: energy-coupling factor transporter transmembrane protein EcfT [Firmicutes bacterium]|nr:energy-coupling factor transporter transmembrane protein EcfT [Bacillota bacterium]